MSLRNQPNAKEKIKKLIFLSITRRDGFDSQLSHRPFTFSFVPRSLARSISIFTTTRRDSQLKFCYHKATFLQFDAIRFEKCFSALPVARNFLPRMHSLLMAANSRLCVRSCTCLMLSHTIDNVMMWIEGEAATSSTMKCKTCGDESISSIMRSIPQAGLLTLR